MTTDNNQIKNITWQDIEPSILDEKYKEFFKNLDPEAFKQILDENSRQKVVESVLKMLQNTDPKNATTEYANELIEIMKRVANKIQEIKPMDLIFTKTSDGLNLPGFYYPSTNKDICVLFIHGMSGFILENYFGHVLGRKLQENNIGYIYAHNRGYAHINDIKTNKTNSEGGFETSRNGAVYERFENCVPDIESWLEKSRELGYKKIIVIGHSLGVSKVVHHFYKTKPEDVVGVILASPPDMVGLVKKTEYQSNYEKLLDEAKQNIQNNNPRKLLSEEVWDWYTLSSQTFVDLFEENGPADNLPILRNPEKFPELESITVPILCIVGENDDIAINSLEEDMAILKSKATNVPSFETYILPRANHVYDGEERGFANKIVEWVTKFKS